MDKVYTRMLDAFRKDQVILRPDMKEFTSFKAGGSARVMIQPASAEEVIKAISICRQEDVPYLVIGNGTNLLVRDEGYEGVVIRMGKEFADVMAEPENRIRAQAGALLSVVSRIAMENSLSGLAFAGGIPGSVGGGTLMNAGAYGGELKDVIQEVTYLTRDGKLRCIQGKDAAFSYRHSIFEKEQGIVLQTLFQLTPGDKEEIAKAMREFSERRNAKQPVHLPSAGSTFKRPEGHFAGQLIEEAGLKGTTVGGASVSQMHAGFIVNEDGASAQDIIDLIKLVQYTVFDKFDVMLEPEVRII